MILKGLGKALARNLNRELHYGLRGITKDAFNDQLGLLSGTKVQTIFDIGANIGRTTAEYTSLFPESTIYSFEPFPEAFQKLRRRFKGHSLVKPVQVAVSAKTGKKKFHVYQDSATNSLLPTADGAEYWADSPNAIKPDKQIEVPVTTIDSFCRQQLIDEIQILKMDIQGGELMALQGAREKLKESSILLIYTECLFVPIYEGQAFFYEICSLLSSYGYKLFDMYNFAYARNGQIKWCDAIFAGSRLAGR